MSNKQAEFGHPCPIRDVLDRIGDQWSMLILDLLSSKTYRFNQLHREIGDISRQMLTVTLKRLESDGYLLRTVYAEVPTRVEYSLTSLGISILQPLRQLVLWADENHQAICESRKLHRLKPL